MMEDPAARCRALAERCAQLERLLQQHGIPLPPQAESRGAAAPLASPPRKKPRGAPQGEPFLADYRPYTHGFGTHLCADPVAEAGRLWNRFYQQNAALAFKDRHYLTREFPEVAQAATLLEVGCGVGNTVFPLRQELPGLRVVCCDLSHVAVGLLRKHPDFSESWCTAFAHDITAAPLPPEVIPAGGCDCASMIFVLSAIAPQHFPTVLERVAAGLRSGGMLYFRDYCRGDLAQERFGSEAQVQGVDNFCMRACGTCAYFFDPGEAAELFARAGLDCVHSSRVEREIVNRKEDRAMQRVWLQARFRKR